MQHTMKLLLLAGAMLISMPEAHAGKLVKRTKKQLKDSRKKMMKNYKDFDGLIKQMKGVSAALTKALDSGDQVAATNQAMQLARLTEDALQTYIAPTINNMSKDLKKISGKTAKQLDSMYNQITKGVLEGVSNMTDGLLVLNATMKAQAPKATAGGTVERSVGGPEGMGGGWPASLDDPTEGLPE